MLHSPLNRDNFNPDPATVHLEAIHPHSDTSTLKFRTHRPAVDCPVCHHQTHQIHSWYQRTLADLPWHGLTVRLELHTRRLRCHNPTSLREVFTERLPELVAPSARRTNRLATEVDAMAITTDDAFAQFKLYGQFLSLLPGRDDVRLPRILRHTAFITPLPIIDATGLIQDGGPSFHRQNPLPSHSA